MAITLFCIFALVGPGRHGVWTGVEKIIFLDVRPMSVLYENRAVVLRDGCIAVYGLTASAEIRNVRTAMYASNNPSLLTAFTLLALSRSILGQYTSNALKLKQQEILAEIQERAKTRLNSAGIELLSFQLTLRGIASSATLTSPSIAK